MFPTLAKTLIICFLVVRAGYVAADSCAVTAVDPTLAAGALQFCLNLYNELNATNLFWSPFSVRVALAMTAVGAGGTTLTQMNQSLQLNGFQNQTASDQAFQAYLASFCSNDNYSLSTANRIYVQKDFQINPTFTQTLQTYFQSDAVTEDFGTDPSGAANEINTWVADQTNNTIKNLFSADSFSTATVLVLVNAIYFKGIWETKFDAADTVDGDFTLANGTTVQVPIMHVTSSFKYYESSSLQCQVVQLNYAGNHLAMHILLPTKGVTLDTVRENLNAENIDDLVKGFKIQQVNVSFPKFQANFKQELSAPLKAIGMVDVFDKVNANLTGIAPSTTQYGNLYVSSVIHQANVAVDEEGTTAAAATGVSVVGAEVAGPPPPEPVVFDMTHDRLRVKRREKNIVIL